MNSAQYQYRQDRREMVWTLIPAKEDQYQIEKAHAHNY